MSILYATGHRLMINAHRSCTFAEIDEPLSVAADLIRHFDFTFASLHETAGRYLEEPTSSAGCRHALGCRGHMPSPSCFSISFG